MKEYPILFSPDMIRALLAGRKSVTRRISKQWLKVKAGDRLWCREAWGIGDGGGRLVDPTINYRAGGQLPLNKIRGTDSVWQHSYTTHCVLGTDLLKIRGGWIPSIHMFRWASRILLECEEDARAEPLWNITESEFFEIMSVQDAEKEADERIVIMERGIKARHAAKDDAKSKGYGKGHGGYGAVDCPCCEGGKLQYSVASYNGHMHGRCTTKGCVSWME